MDLPVWSCTGSGSRHSASSPWLPVENPRDAGERPPTAPRHVLLRSRRARRWPSLVGDHEIPRPPGLEDFRLTGVPRIGNGARNGPDVESFPRFWTLSDGWRLLRRLALGPSLEAFPTASQVGNPSAPPGPLRQLGREVAALLTFPDESRGWLLRAALRTRSLMRRLQPQVVVSSGPQHTAHLVAGLATMGSTVPWLIDLRDPWAGPLSKIWESDRMFGSRLFRVVAPRLERLAFRAAQGIITNT